MKITILTLFPSFFDSFWGNGIVKKAITLKKLFHLVYSIRAFASKKKFKVDDKPFGGGEGMILKPEPIVCAVNVAKKNMSLNSKVILLSPQGKKLDAKMLNNFMNFDGLIFICGRYDGLDERAIRKCVDFEVSIGDYVISGGELACMVVVDALVRIIPGVLENPNSIFNETFNNGLLKHPQYTKPYLFDKNEVPGVLVSGNHKKIKQWKEEMSIFQTLLKRKDLLEKKDLNLEEIKILKKWHKNIGIILQK